MEEWRVREVFYEKLARLGDANEAFVSAYFSVANYIVAQVTVPRNDPAYWQAVHTALRMKANTCREEMQLGVDDFDPVPFGARFTDVLMDVLRQEQELLEYLHDRFATLACPELAALLSRAAIQRKLVQCHREQERIMRDCARDGCALVSRARIQELYRVPDAITKVLLGADVFARFLREFTAAVSCLRQEQSQLAGKAPGSVN